MLKNKTKRHKKQKNDVFNFLKKWRSQMRPQGTLSLRG